ncbi:MAG TPA: methionyl-tRNA formyltransferase [Acidobacteriaceae bacterium]|jgi:methionyl-tRNA formyltransferase|nr:methionyl-tRNA formyltransferase [Acidobacteriaceae bacterium]
MRLVFCGTPAFAVPTLNALLAAGHTVTLVLTQPDRASGRGMLHQASAVKQAALEHNLSIAQPEKIRNNPELQQQLTAIAADAIIVVAYGRIIPPWMLILPRLGNLNLHASLLPKYRGAAPIQWAIARGELETGVTTMRLDEGLDTGDMLLQRSVPIEPEQTSAELFPALAELGARLMIETLAGLEKGTLIATPQDDSFATLAPILQREDGHMDCAMTARELYNRWRGFQPWPGAYGFFREMKFTVHRMCLAAAPAQTSAQPGTLLSLDHRLWLACGKETWVELLEVQLEGKKRISATDFLHGHRLSSGERLA